MGRAGPPPCPPHLPLDNNTAERALRGPVVGRKNYYGAGSLASARLAAQAWTITATAQLAGANPLAYLTAYLQACADTGGHPPTGQALQRFLPWHASPADLAAWHNGDTPLTTTTDTTEYLPRGKAVPARQSASTRAAKGHRGRVTEGSRAGPSLSTRPVEVRPLACRASTRQTKLAGGPEPAWGAS